MFERGALATGGLPFAELKTRALINAAAKAADATPRFLPAHPHRIARLLNHENQKSNYANANQMGALPAVCA